MTKKILLVGAGKIGEAIAILLKGVHDYELLVADRSEAALARLQQQTGAKTLVLDVYDAEAFETAARGKFALISASPFFLTEQIATMARKVGAHYLDLTEDVNATELVSNLAKNAPTAFIPQCGLAPGYISIVTNDLANKFDSLETIRMRVGALPRFPTNAMKYNLTWSTEGLINEYCQPCDAIVDGHKVKTIPLEGLEEFALDGVRYEAFNTSGGLGTMCQTYANRVTSMDYRSVRYPGHNAVMKVLLQDLKLSKRRDLLKEILENAVPATLQDVVLIFVTVSGTQNGRYLQEGYVSKIFDQEVKGQHLSAIQITTASALLAVLDLLSSNQIKQSGLVRQEDVDHEQFLANRFGRYYDKALDNGQSKPLVAAE